MQEILEQFLSGVNDGWRLSVAMVTILSNKQLRWLNLKCFVLNGLLFLGAVIVYKTVSSMLFYSSASAQNDDLTKISSKESSLIETAMCYAWSIALLAVRLLMDTAHYLWLTFIYLITLVLSTLWVQDIFDCLMEL